MKKTLCALTMLSATSVPVMAAGLDLTVGGTIDPVACALSLPGGTTVNYGVIDPSLLSVTSYTTLQEIQINIALNCSAPTKMALKAVNRRPGTMAGVSEDGNGISRAPVSLFSASDTDGVGLGVDGSKKIGGYGLRLAPGTLTVDGKTVDLIRYGTPAWVPTASGSLYVQNEVRFVSWANPGTVIPIAFQSMAGKIGVQAYINKKSELDLNNVIKLDGLTALELVYL